jgi:hypothetical protein
MAKMYMAMNMDTDIHDMGTMSTWTGTWTQTWTWIGMDIEMDIDIDIVLLIL